MNKQLFYTEAQKLGIANTPLMPYEEDFDADIFFKAESFNASGSIKDRPALAMILQAEQDGSLKQGDVIVEATSGNMGISLAYVGLKRGYKVVLTMPDNMSKERCELLEGLGAHLLLTEGAKGMQGAIEKAEELAKKGAVYLKQFENKMNTEAHYISTAEEIAQDLERVDVFVVGVGTGGTLIGTGKRLKEIFPTCQVIGVEPLSSAVLSGKTAGVHAIQGIGANFVPPLYDKSVVDAVMQVGDEEALDLFRLMNKKQGYCCGISSAANIAVCIRLANLPEYKGKNIVTVFPDADDRYLSLLKSSK